MRPPQQVQNPVQCIQRPYAAQQFGEAPFLQSQVGVPQQVAQPVMQQPVSYVQQPVPQSHIPQQASLPSFAQASQFGPPWAY